MEQEQLFNFEEGIKEFSSQNNLSPREKDVFILLTQKVVNFKEIAARLEISPNTVNNHITNIFEKTKTNSKTELLAVFLVFIYEKFRKTNFLLKKPRVLLVDDEELILEYLRDSLESKGINCHCANSPEEALKLISDYSFDTIVSDIRMPGMDGVSFLKEIKRLNHYAPAIMLMTGYSEFQQDEILNYGAVDFFEKPVNVNLVYRSIIEHFIQEIGDRNQFFEMKSNFPVLLESNLKSKIQNIGFGGVFIPIEDPSMWNAQPFEVGNHLNFQFKVPDVNDEVSATGEIVWKRINEERNLLPGMGVKFIHLSKEGQRTIEEFVRKRKILSFIPIGDTKLSKSS